MICLVGVNGSGKSSLLSIIFKSLLEMTKESSPDYQKGVGKESEIVRNFSTAEIRHTTHAYAIKIDWSFKQQKKEYKVFVRELDYSLSDLSEIIQEFDLTPNADSWFSTSWNIGNTRANDWVAKQVVLYRPSYRFEKPNYEEKSNISYSPSLNDNWDNTRLLPFSVSTGLLQLEKLLLDIMLDKFISESKTEDYFDKIFNFLYDINPEYSGVTIPNWPFRRIGVGKLHALSLLSAGELDLLITAASIVAQQIYLKRKFNVEKAGGIVIIDEVNANLHPELQENVIPLFCKHFPEIQFIITTHSPFVLRSLKKETTSIIKLPSGLELQEDFAAMSIENILNSAFEVYGKWSKEVTEEIEEFESLLSEKEKDFQKIEVLYSSYATKSYSLKSKLDQLLALYADYNLIDYIKEKQKNEES